MRDGDALVLLTGRERQIVARVEDMPMAAGGAARHNVANALAAIAAAGGLGIPLDAVRATLRRFGRDPADNPGRANVYEIGGIRSWWTTPTTRTGWRRWRRPSTGCRRRGGWCMIGQAGDRDDAAIRDLARAALALRPDRVVVKEMDAYLRGRAPGEVPGADGRRAPPRGIAGAAISTPGTEMPAVREALGWARPGDLLVLTLHQERRRVEELLEALRDAGWKAGEPLPEAR